MNVFLKILLGIITIVMLPIWIAIKFVYFCGILFHMVGEEILIDLDNLIGKANE